MCLGSREQACGCKLCSERKRGTDFEGLASGERCHVQVSVLRAEVWLIAMWMFTVGRYLLAYTSVKYFFFSGFLIYLVKVFLLKKFVRTNTEKRSRKQGGGWNSGPRRRGRRSLPSRPGICLICVVSDIYTDRYAAKMADVRASGGKASLFNNILPTK